MSLRSQLTSSKDEMWKQLAEKIGGKFSMGKDIGKDSIRLSAGQWEITLDDYVEKSGRGSQIVTRMRAPFLNRDGFYFKIFRESALSPVSKLFGMQDIIIGDNFFDKTFVIQGNDEKKVKMLFRDENLKKLIQSQPDICFEIKDDEGHFHKSFPEGVDELHFRCSGIIEDQSRLENLFEMFTITLSRLVQIDSAYEDDPGIVLQE